MEGSVKTLRRVQKPFSIRLGIFFSVRSRKRRREEEIVVTRKRKKMLFLPKIMRE